tara:strand:+ start:619 stop:1242 length:624 start_codon:yes stop_codon:yes gene_type:complete
MKFKLFIFMIYIAQFSGCSTYETQLNDSIQVNNEGIESRLSTLENEIDELKQELNQITTRNSQLNSRTLKGESEPNINYDNSENAKKEFESSFELLRKGDYISAEIALREYINNFPNGTYTDDAKFWLAESLFSQNKYNEALEIFNQIINQYPDSEKMMESILKSGFSHQELGNLSAAEAIFQRVIREYPNSSASSLADERLNKMRE